MIFPLGILSLVCYSLCLTVWLFLCDCQLILEIIFKNFLLLASVDCAPIFCRNCRIKLALRVVACLCEVVDCVLYFLIVHAVSMIENLRKSNLFFNFFKKKQGFVSRWLSRTYGGGADPITQVVDNQALTQLWFAVA